MNLKFAGAIALLNLLQSVVGSIKRTLQGGRDFRRGRRGNRGERWSRFANQKNIDRRNHSQREQEFHPCSFSMNSARGVVVRIALVHFSYAPVIGGVETILAAHARLFAQHGHDVTVICKRGTSAEPRIRVQILGESADGLRESLRAQDVVFIHNVLSMPFAPAWTELLWQLADELEKVRFISWIHDLAACNPDYAVPGGSLLAKAHPRIEHVVISAHRQRQFIELTGSRCLVVPNGIDPARTLGLTENVAALAERFPLCGSPWVLIHPTRLLIRKNIELSLHVTHALRSSGHDCYMVVTGPPDAQNAAMARYGEQLHRLRDQLGLADNVLFLHDHFEVGETDLRSLYLLADALFFPSRQEGFGLPVLEAALYRLPIFCSDIAPMNALIKGLVHGFTLDMRPNGIAALIATTLAHSPETQARKSVYGKYAWVTIYEKFLAPLLNAAAFLSPQ
ncbi:MAG: hypothetical protein JWL90_3555 [Chthoniobacteraceae bacterium]|nr:hypothetical protein [Chthoniobacteraceae bacterium]